MTVWARANSASGTATIPTASHLKIAVIGHIRHAIAPPFMGGMEAHCHALCRTLAVRGHDVTLFAAAGSECEGGTLEPICDAPYEACLPWDRFRGTPELEAFQRAAFGKAWDAIVRGRYDVVHNNCLNPAFLSWAARDSVPLLTSLHVPPFANLHRAVSGLRHVPHIQTSVTSASQVPLWFDPAPPTMSVVHNGVDCETWRPGARGETLVWAGRVTPNKGTAQAVRAARAAGVQLDVVGPIEDESYFAREVLPLLDDRIRYLGHLAGDDLVRTVASAAAVIATPMWDEPFGLVAAEALACDVPVIAFARGGLPEVVGSCGALLPPGNQDALAYAMVAPPQLEPGVARQRAQALFSLDSMARSYERLYARARIGMAHVPVAA
jgi:glycosyltransferase involved in cell wall biosynthesis